MQRREVSPAVAVQGTFLLFGVTIAAFFPFLALYLERTHGLTKSEIGFVIAGMSAARLIASPVWGHYADTKIGRLAAIQIGAAGAALFAFGMNLVESFAALMVVAMLQQAFMIAGGPNVDAIALAHLGDERMSDYGRIRGWESMTYAAGCLLFGAVLELAGVRWTMPIFGVCSVAMLAWSPTLGRDRPAADVGNGRLGAVGALFRETPRLWGFLAASLLIWTGFMAAWNFISLKIADGGGGPLLIGIGTALGGLAEVPFMRGSSRLQRRLGLRAVFLLGCGTYAVAFFLWGVVSDPTVLSLLTVFEGAAFGLLFTTGVVVVGRLAPPSLYATGNAVGQMVWFGIGPVIGAGVGGVVYQHLGPGALYGGSFALALIAMAVAWFALSTPELAEPEVV